MLAQMMAGNSGSRLVALDRTAAKAGRVRQLVDSWGVGDSVQVIAADATQLYQQPTTNTQQQEAVGNIQRAVTQVAAEGASHPADLGSGTGSRTQSLTGSSGKKRSRHKAQEAQQEEQQQLSAELLAVAQPESFDSVLLDAPCSALGLRPRLLMDWRLPQLEAIAAYQRAMLHSAVHVLKPGGHLVFCTCTINPGGLAGCNYSIGCISSSMDSLA